MILKFLNFIFHIEHGNDLSNRMYVQISLGKFSPPQRLFVWYRPHGWLFGTNGIDRVGPIVNLKKHAVLYRRLPKFSFEMHGFKEKKNV